MSHPLSLEPVRLLFVIDNLQFGGGERVFSQIINGLNSGRYHISLISSSNEQFRNAIQNPQVQYHNLDFFKRFNPVSIFKMVKIIRNNRIQIIHGQGARAEFHARIAKRIAGNPLYISTIAMPVEGFDVGFIRKKAYRFADYFSEQYVDRFIVVSDALKEMLIHKRNIPDSTVVRIFNGIELDSFTPNPEFSSFREQLQISRNTFLIGAIGRMVWQKGFEYLIRAIPMVIDAYPDSKFLLVGDGPLNERLKNLVRRFKIEKHVVFTGFRNDISEILSAIDLLAVPSIIEGFPMITLEAMAMMKPIIASNIDGISEQIIDGESGILIPPKDSDALAGSIIDTLRNKGLKKTLGINARKRVETAFSIEKMLFETEKIYQLLCRQ